MKIQPYATLFALSLFAPAAAASPRPTPSPTEADALRAHCDASLESLRAGRVELPTLLGAVDRAELRAAESRSADLDDMRAGYLEFTDREWTMIAVGALIVILIIIVA